MLEHLSLPETVRLTLRRRILNAELPAGTRLIEAGLAGEYNVSRATIRQALHALQAEGLVEISPRRHSVVTRLSVEDATDICHARSVLEASAAQETVRVAPDSLFEALDETVGRMERAARVGDIAELVDTDIRFHTLIVTTCGRRRLLELWQTLDGQIGALMRSTLDREQEDLADVVQWHRDLLEVLATRVPEEAAREVRHHYMANAPGWTRTGSPLS
ncbi:GntR family transcriptional regulator [Streptomyces sp. AM 4-1-1]|uniref:GntR family transcriptional regulator n=1 Tax=unclassified Streptomyces TaxID=2593676 RepID=UPI0023B8EF34|nr:GntR family transcriptional regulator [Streptomyces sp. AM 4-1-1]WEH37184.1 GntR family transcriptional regulator [Streptomyces sp. AM 4-1-1]